MTQIRSQEIKLVPIDQIRPNQKNRNQHSEEQIVRLSEIIKYQGFRDPLIVSNQSGMLVSGHGRLMAALKLGLKELPVTYQDFENEDQEYAAMVSENSIAAWATLDLSGINSDLGELDPSFELDMLGIKDFVLEMADKIPLTDEDSVPEKVEPRTKLGDVYLLGEHRLMCGDSTDPIAVAKLMNDKLGDLLVTDPPYGVSYIEKNAAVHGGIVKNNIGKQIKNDSGTVEEMGALWAGLFSHADHFSDQASYYVFSPQGGELMMMMMMQAIHQSNWQLKHSLIWQKQNFVFGRCDYHYQHEPVLYGWKKKGTHNWYADRSQSSLLQFDKPHRSDLHPTTKPIDILEYLIKNSSKLGDLVVDLFCGSGSTLIASEKSGRICFGMELDPHYCDVVVTRWEQFTGQKAEMLDHAEET